MDDIILIRSLTGDDQQVDDTSTFEGYEWADALAKFFALVARGDEHKVEMLFVPESVR